MFEAIKFARGSKKYDKSSHGNTEAVNFTVQVAGLILEARIDSHIIKMSMLFFALLSKREVFTRNICSDVQGAWTVGTEVFGP